MATKLKVRTAPRIDAELLADNFVEQLLTGYVCDAKATGIRLPALQSARSQSVEMERCVLRDVALPDPAACKLRLGDVQIEDADLANIDLTSGSLERVEIVSARLTGATFSEAQLTSVLFRDCKLDFAVLRMARLQLCVFENCNLTDADFYGADLSGTIFRDCNLSQADVSQAKLNAADVRDCRLDGLRGTPASMDGLMISPDQASMLITLFGVRVAW
ncbi:pentapeptide repeat-containing protein [Granulicella arctica]|uniref:pentapeptide repeat-containing protein n=1 Tax=Granulicella arctica TaxID=940613 RepID=UPI0021E0CE9A|nr:pentapeptide repeat-containing protein [Granulicella arctica]